MPALNLRIPTRRTHDEEPRVAAAFLRWTCARALFHRGYVLTSSIYFVTDARLSASGIALARRDRQILLVLVATMVFNGADMISWLFTRRLVELGLPGDPAVSYAAAGILSSAAGAIALRLVEARIEGAGAARRAYALGCLAGASGLVMLALAPDLIVGRGHVGDVHRLRRAYRLCRRADNDPQSEVRNG